VSSALVGRGRELSVMAEFVSDCHSGGGSLVLLGEPGAGKSALLYAADREANHQGIQVLRAAGVEFEAEVGYSGIHQLLMPLLDQLPALADAHREALTIALGLASGTPPDKLLLAGAILALLDRAAAQAPLLLVLDDLQWFDDMSSWLLLFAARRFPSHRIGLLGATRSGASGRFEGAGLPELDVQPLSTMAAGELLELRYPGMTPAVRDRILTEAQGNPLALLELPRALSKLIETPQEELPEILTLTGRLNRLFIDRIAALPSEARRILLLAALDGGADLFQQIEPTSECESLRLLRAAEKNDLVRMDPGSGRFVFRHPLIRSAVVGLATGEEVRDAHKRLAELYIDDPGRQARHLSAATQIPDEQVATILERLAKKMRSRGDARGAADAFTHSARLTVNGSERARRLSEAAFLAATGDLRNVEKLLEEARLADPDLNTSLYFASAAAYMMTNGDGDLETAHRFLVTTIESQLDAHNPPPEDAMYLVVKTLGYLCYLSANPDAWQPFHEAIQRMGDQAGVISLSDRLLSDPLRATPDDLDALEHAIETLDKELDQWKICEVAGLAASVDRLVACRDPLWRVARQGRDGQAPAQAVSALNMLAFDDFVSGRWSDMDDVIIEGLDHCRSVPNPNGEWVLRYHAAMVAAGRGDEASVRSHTEWINRWGAPRGVGLALKSTNQARALAAMGRGDFEQAYQLATAICPAGTIEPYNLHALWVTLDLVEAAVRTGRMSQARAHVEAMDNAGFGRVSSRLALLHRGSLALAHAGEEDADKLFRAALESPDSGRWLFERARIELSYGEYLRRKRAHLDARGPLQRAHETFAQLDATPWLNRTERELRASGLEAPREKTGTVVLTAQELEIAQLAAAGLTNKEIGARLLMSHRTVSSHLYRVFPKLGITTRAALRDALESDSDPSLS
jgi:DNA-binding CsgD family transcriptional regulator